jgi:transcriptional regulator with XRE-family HTH domain
VFTWTDDLRREAKEQQKQQVLELYLACKSQQEIAEAVGIDQGTVSRWLEGIMQKYDAELLHNPPDSLQTFNLWSFQRPDPRYGLDYPGRVPGQNDAIHRLRGTATEQRSGR